jgi:2-polyprenyl-6-methoxyphenol hydroxylase-like FAD-dependent oxidoreductase
VVAALAGKNGKQLVSCRAAIAADGLSGTFLPRDRVWSSQVAGGSRFGVGTRIPLDPQVGALCPAHTVSFFAARAGYLGLARLSDGTLDAAAALDPGIARRLGGPGPAIGAILHDCAVDPVEALTTALWKGTALLTRRRTPERGRVVVVGDAAGYVEPFTGEGMSWALRGGLAAGRHARAIVDGVAVAGEWERTIRSMTRQRQFACRAITLALRSPRLVSCAAAVIDHFPEVGAQAARIFAGPWHRPEPIVAQR